MASSSDSKNAKLRVSAYHGYETRAKRKMSYIEAILALMLLLGFVALRPSYKVLFSIIVMTQSFDILPRMIENKDIWDLGAMMLMLTWGQLLLQRRNIRISFGNDVHLLTIFFAWMVCSFVWSLLIYQYPLVDTVKASRHLILGYLSFFIFVRLRAVDPKGFELVQKALYIITFMLMPACIVQYLIGKPVLSGLITDYGGALRGLPIFLPFCLLHFWVISSNILAGRGTRFHEWIYAVMTIIVTALTFTRGIYLAVGGVFLLMLWILFKAKKVRLGSLAIPIALAFACIVGLISSGVLDRVVGRFSSGIDILFAGQAAKSTADVDTFSERLALAGERFVLVAHDNPLFGYGFIHENNVPDSFRKRLRHASIIQTPEYQQKYRLGHPYVPALLSVDIGWADIVIKTGLVGFALLMMFLTRVLFNYSKNIPTDPSSYHFRLACYLQIAFTVLTMFNGNPLVGHVQIPMFIFASFVIYSQKEQQFSPTSNTSLALNT